MHDDILKRANDYSKDRWNAEFDSLSADSQAFVLHQVRALAERQSWAAQWIAKGRGQ